MKRIIFHADDFGANREISEHILDCCEAGAIWSMSVITNTPEARDCMHTFYNCGFGQKTGIHFNLAEGPALSKAAVQGSLTDGRGMFCMSFQKLLLMSFSHERYALGKQIKEELRRQLRVYLDMRQEAGMEWKEARRLRVDSHQHYHMIPLVLEAMLEVIKEEQCIIEYIRIPAEPLAPFIRHTELYMSYKPINLVKSLVLNALNIIDAPLLTSYRKKSALFFGIMLSGNMDLARVKVLLPDFIELARKKRCRLEVLAHPGGMENGAPDEDFPDAMEKDCVRFYISRGRRNEKHMLMSLSEHRYQEF